ncbi:uncharacterized protein LOC109834216 isoform X2 [Asparagus officinalis]|nr:uncharacterized protein LOC109834216 isoform X2 [Asparagus officinalis]XP_020257780.1 uncharacterized protein LOC109834216 isoform X2 [Asparagus officinalis]
MSRAMDRLKSQIIEDGGTPTMLKLYLGTHSSSVDKITGEYTYPDNSTKEYCNRVIQEATLSGVDSATEDDALCFTQILDSMHGEHHGGYEKATGIGATRTYLRVSSIPKIGTSNQELCREVADLRARVAEMDSLREQLREELREEFRSQMQLITNNMVTSQVARPAPTRSDPPAFTRPASIPQPATDIPHSARPASTVNTSTSSAQGL